MCFLRIKPWGSVTTYAKCIMSVKKREIEKQPYDGSNVRIKLGHEDTRSNNEDVQRDDVEETEATIIKNTAQIKVHTVISKC